MAPPPGPAGAADTLGRGPGRLSRVPAGNAAYDLAAGFTSRGGRAREQPAACDTPGNNGASPERFARLAARAGYVRPHLRAARGRPLAYHPGSVHAGPRAGKLAYRRAVDPGPTSVVG
ncbi:hypothetical protein [Hymenobacter roseosalivarius]|uniref:hypothetical protein n=1 Tax=Hymenobacter roseosalivarius TaxID=89967 RepID=UPI0009FEB947|nr:hypothetical protein [Hymenobacter roseosalivarius]